MPLEADTKTTRSQSLGWHVKQLGAALDREMDVALKPLGLNQAQFMILMTLLELGPSPQIALARRSSMPVYAMSRALDRLEASGFLLRKDHPSSRRTHIIELTEKGEAVGPKLFAIVKHVNATCTAGFPENEINALRHAVEGMTANLAPRSE